MTSVCLLTSNETAKIKLQNVFAEDFTVQEYDIEDPPNKIDWLLIEERFRIENTYYDLFNLWKDYLKDYTISPPKVSILTQHRSSYEMNTNYLYVPDLTEIIIKNAYKNAKNVKFYNNIPKSENNIREQLEKFFTGHGAQSLFLKLNYLRMSIINTEESITGENGRTFQDASTRMIPMAKELWNEFLDRWENYEVYFKYTPFADSYKIIPTLLDEIRPFFNLEMPSEKEFLSFSLKANIEKTRTELKKMDKYVRPEIYKEDYSLN